ncbi:MAG: hypothetical protein BWK72_17420 [Rhodoferax ferrireducens]|uniref:Helix-turn-helix domain-containing protein n=1 Tax=Rhodoferax ferrireducens TaxID=192843 RepID=A0A1W9KQ98_9BURK|nr:MAG: hypothetical protein BWK72_17420 [Rhodoferax ferrireducens]
MTQKEKKVPKVPNLNRPNMTEADAAFYLGLSISSLRKSRMNGARTNHLPPPPYVKLGRRVVYRSADLARYLEANLAYGPAGAAQ